MGGGSLAETLYYTPAILFQLKIELKYIIAMAPGGFEYPCFDPDDMGEIPFGGRETADDDIERRLRGLRRNSTTSLLNARENPLSVEDREKEIQKR